MFGPYKYPAHHLFTYGCKAGKLTIILPELFQTHLHTAIFPSDDLLHRTDFVRLQYNITSSILKVGLQVWRPALILSDFVLRKMFTSSEFDGIVALELGGGTGKEIPRPLGYRAAMDSWRTAPPSTCHTLLPSEIPSSSSPPLPLLPSSSSPSPSLLPSSSRKRPRSPSLPPSPLPLPPLPSPPSEVVPPPPKVVITETLTTVAPPRLCRMIEEIHEHKREILAAKSESDMRIEILKQELEIVRSIAEAFEARLLQRLSFAEIEQIIAQRVANAIETIEIYETKTYVAYESMNHTKWQEDKMVENASNKRKWEETHSGNPEEQSYLLRVRNARTLQERLPKMEEPEPDEQVYRHGI
nr:methyltransferase-like protein 22 [Tanacetum cinerariifolium]